MLTIGNVQLKTPLILAPLSGISDLPFRMINRRFDCELAFVEMINARSISHKSKKTKHMLTTGTDDTPLGVQLIGCEPKYILKAIDALSRYTFELLDFNAACPAKKVTRRGEGAYLLKHPKKLNALLSLIVRNSPVPVTVKLRIGWDDHSINAKETALAAQDAGVHALFVHGRTKTQNYSGDIHYQILREVKQNVQIPVIASGNIFSPQLAKHMLDETGCDGLLIARGALGNPWIFKQILEFLKKGTTTTQANREEIVTIMTEHLGHCVDFYGEKIGVMRFRKFYAWYTKGIVNTRALRHQSSHAKTKEAMTALIRSLVTSDKESIPLVGAH